MRRRCITVIKTLLSDPIKTAPTGRSFMHNLLLKHSAEHQTQATNQFPKKLLQQINQRRQHERVQHVLQLTPQKMAVVEVSGSAGEVNGVANSQQE